MINMKRTQVQGIDLFDMPVKAVKANGEIFVDDRLEYLITETPKVSRCRHSMNEFISKKIYWGDFETIHSILKHINKKMRKGFMKHTLLLSVPYDITAGSFANIFDRMVSEAGLQAGWRTVKLIDNIICAAVGAGIPVDEAIKFPLIYSNSWCTYICVIYAGFILKAEIINENVNHIDSKTLLAYYNKLIAELPAEVPEYFQTVKLSVDKRKDILDGWYKPLGNSIHMIVPTEVRSRLGNNLEKYELIYTNHYEGVIINGLAAILQRTDKI